MDEAIAVNGPVLVNLELRRDNLDSFSKIDNFWLSLAANIVMIFIVFGVMYKAFPIVRTTIFGISTKMPQKEW